MQSKVPDIEFLGPFMGLDTTRTARRLDPRFASVATNVLVSDGTIKPRPPLVPWATGSFPDWHRVLSIFHYNIMPPSGVPNPWYDCGLPGVLVKAVSADLYNRLWLFWNVGSTLHSHELSAGVGLGSRPATFVLADGWVYVLDGSEVAGEGCTVRTDGMGLHTYRRGLPVPAGEVVDDHSEPVAGHVDASQWIGGPPDGPGDGDYNYAVTFYDEATGTESNPWYSGVFTLANQGYVKFRFATGTPELPVGYAYTHWRIYRKNITERQVGYRLIIEKTIGTADTFDSIPESAITLSTETGGPWAPSRNGRPPPSTVGVIWERRLWCNDLRDGAKLCFSAIGKYDHFDPDDWFPLDSEHNDQITGMAVLAGQLVICKEHSVWLAAGKTLTPTNETTATAVELPEEVEPEIYRTRCGVGCSQVYGGNGAIVTGNPAMLYFNGANGLYVFNGTDARCVSDMIRATWRAATDYSSGAQMQMAQSISYAIDSEEQILYMAQLLRGSDDTQVLAYHYGRDRGDGVGAWTQFSVAGRVDCISSMIGIQGQVNWPIPTVHCGLLAGGTDDGLSFLDARGVSTDPKMPAYEYKTGLLVPIEGKVKSHLYGLAFLHAAINLSATFAVRAVQDDEATTQSRSMRGQLASTINVSRTAAAFELGIAGGGGGQDWNPDVSFTGWQMDVEPSGS